MKGYTLPLLLVTALGGCTSAGQGMQDVGEARQVIKESIGRQVEAVGWRDTEILAVHRARNTALLRAADDAVRANDMATAKKLWAEALKNLEEFRPVEKKIENIKRVKDVIRPPKPGTTSMTGTTAMR